MTLDMTPGAWPRRGLVWPPTEECGSTEGYQEWRERMLQRPEVRAEYERQAERPERRMGMGENLRVWWQNLLNLPWLTMAKILRRRGWVAFYLEPEHRTCSEGTCWLELYEVAASTAKIWDDIQATFT